MTDPAADLARRAEIVAEARRWLGTPYHHRASRREAGADCLGLIRGVYRACVGPEPVDVAPYTATWADATGGEPLLAAAFAALVPVEPAQSFGAGDVLVFRMPPAGVAKHAGIATGPDRMIHAYESAGAVEVSLGRWWRRRIAAAFSFPASGHRT